MSVSFYYGKTIFIVYTDDTILLGPDKEEIDQLVEKLGKTFKIEDQGNLSDYLGTKDKGLIMKPNHEGMECWVDAAHASEWNNKTASSDPSTARSRMGYIITYAGCPMHWSSKMQTEIALSTTEAEVHRTFSSHEGGFIHHMANGRSKATRNTSIKCNS